MMTNEEVLEIISGKKSMGKYQKKKKLLDWPYIRDIMDTLIN